MASILEQITAINQKMSSLQSSLPALITAEAAWRTQSKVVCDQLLKSKREECLADKAMKLRKANEYAARITSIKGDIERLQGEVATLKEVQKAQNEATVNLSQDGKSLEALVLEAEGKNNSAMAIADAKAQAITTESRTTADSKKTTTYVILGIVVIVVIVTVLLVVKKIKSKKS